MKTLLSVMAVIAGMGIGSWALEKTASAKPANKRYIIGLSPYLEKATKDPVYRQITRFLLEEAPLNSSVWIYDAWNVRTITKIEIPDVRAFRSGKTRANQFKEQIQALRGFLAAEHPEPTNNMKFAQALRLPQFMDFVGANLHAKQDETLVILLGGPLYMDPKEPGFSMIDGYFPSDGHLLANREKSVFGLKDRSKTLKGIKVYWGYFGDPWVSELHQEKIRRFWDLYLDGQGASLGVFCGDLATVFNSVQGQQSGKETRDEIDKSQTKVEMLRITRDVGVADWITRDVLPGNRPGPPARTVGPMKIGIRWKGNIDLDLYATPRRDAETLFFEHMRSPEGYYFKDHRSSPDREYEFIEFESPVNVWEVEASINYFKGNSSGPSGEIRIEFDGKIYSGEFALAAARGNEGRSGPRQRENWTRINVPEILRLQTRTAQAEEQR